MDTLSNLYDTFFDWQLIWDTVPALITVGLPNTLILALSSGVIGTIIGLGLAVAGMSRSRWLRWPARMYTDVFRGLPAAVVILLIGLGFGPTLTQLTGSRSPFPLGIAALSLMAAAYFGEIFRSGIQSVDSGQLEASRALGFSYRRSMALVVVPQGIRRVLPAIVNQFISLIKDSSLISVVAVTELTLAGKTIQGTYFLTMEVWLTVAALYFSMTFPLSLVSRWLEKRFAYK